MRSVLVVCLAVGLACSPTVERQQPKTGDEGGQCYGNQTCNGYLTCTPSNICVNLGTGGAAGAGQGGTTSGPGTGGTNSTGGSSSTAGTVDAGGASGTGGSSATGGVHGTGGSSAACVPNCSGRACGPDPLCQTACGTCAAGLTCSAGVCISPTPLKLNGDTCSAGLECASGYCGVNMVGEARCYGSALANEICGTTYDCRWGVCILKSLGGSTHVCVEGLSACQSLSVSDQCQSAMVAYCQLVQYCGAGVSVYVTETERTDFNACVAISCGSSNASQTPAACQNYLNMILNGTAPCP